MSGFNTECLDIRDADYAVAWEDELDRMGPLAKFADLARHYEKAPLQDSPQKQYLADFLLTEKFVANRNGGNTKGN
ncbi:hypothetical protein ACKF11_13455 [Methylobacillus sp. Pita2]|uniref:hypothetical protein n=1 Tax=Methylobacillus sp. Pita2 TaxID=3383245 RepID=UPI0038B51F2D